MKYEIHIQEIFQGEEIVLSINGLETARFEAHTRFQIGLAHVESIEIKEGDTITLKTEALNNEVQVTAETKKPFLAVTLHDGRLEANAKKSTPRYI